MPRYRHFAINLSAPPLARGLITWPQGLLVLLCWSTSEGGHKLNAHQRIYMNQYWNPYQWCFRFKVPVYGEMYTFRWSPHTCKHVFSIHRMSISALKRLWDVSEYFYYLMDIRKLNHRWRKAPGYVANIHEARTWTGWAVAFAFIDTLPQRVFFNRYRLYAELIDKYFGQCRNISISIFHPDSRPRLHFAFSKLKRDGFYTRILRSRCYHAMFFATRISDPAFTFPSCLRLTSSFLWCEA